MPDCECGVPSGAIVLSHLCIFEYMDPESGEIFKLDMSCDGDGGDLPVDKYFSLAEWARLMGSSEIIASLVHDYIFAEEDEEE